MNPCFDYFIKESLHYKREKEEDKQEDSPKGSGEIWDGSRD